MNLRASPLSLSLSLSPALGPPRARRADSPSLTLADVPQTEEARMEAFQLMNIKRNLVTPRNGEPIIAATQDFITGCYLITRRDTFFNRQEFVQACAYLQDAELEVDLPPPTIWKPERMWTGKQVFSVLMRPNRKSQVNVNLECKNKTFGKPSREWADSHDIEYPPFMSVNDGFLVVQNSEIISGVFDKSTVGDGNKKSVFAVIQRDFGADEAAKCMNRMAKLCARWLGASSVSPPRSLPPARAQADSLHLVSQPTRASRSASATSRRART